ncbi:hypothetical protein LXL04_002963 [Taraxacum kok-saghyz]
MLYNGVKHLLASRKGVKGDLHGHRSIKEVKQLAKCAVLVQQRWLVLLGVVVMVFSTDEQSEKTLVCAGVPINSNKSEQLKVKECKREAGAQHDELILTLEPENSHTINFFRKTDFGGAKKRSNTSPVAIFFFRKTTFFFKKHFTYMQKKIAYMHISSFCFKNAEFFYRSLHNIYLKGFVKKHLKKKAPKKMLVQMRTIIEIENRGNKYGHVKSHAALRRQKIDLRQNRISGPDSFLRSQIQ